jgi:adenylate kinase
MPGQDNHRKTEDARKPFVVILLGAPGSGKGTQSRELSKATGLAHISTGELLRKTAREDSDLGRMIQRKMNAGELVQDDLVCQMIGVRTKQPDCQRGAILDGFPRTIGQAMLLSPLFPPRQTIALNMQMSHAVLIQRVLGRLTCPTCGEIYNVSLRPPQKAGICDHDSSTLERRSDDNEVTVRQRLLDYENQVQPLAEHFREMKVLRDINADVHPEVISEQLRELVQAAIGLSDKKISVSSFTPQAAIKRRRP